MEVLYRRCAGLDVHQQSVVACARWVEGRKVHQEVETFKTTTKGLKALRDWLLRALLGPTRGEEFLSRIKQNPHERPNRPKKSYAPLVHAASRKVRRELYEGYRAFVAVYREAVEKLRAGDRAVVFPAGSFPPAMPFVGG